MAKAKELQFISIQDRDSTRGDQTRTVSIAHSGNTGKITLLGILPHGTELGIDRENGLKLIELIKKCIGEK